MNRFLVRWSALACTAAGLALSSAGVFAQASITLNGVNCPNLNISGTAPNWTISCASTPPAGPSGCSIAQSPSGTLPAGGGAVTLNASCTGGTGISWSWSGGFAQGLTGAQVNGSVTTTTAFTATATNASGTASPGITVQVGLGGGGPGGPISCAGFNNTIVVQENWANPVRQYAQFGPNDAVVVEFTTGPTAAPGRTGGITGAEYGSPPSERIYAISATPCDFVGLANGTSDTVFLNYSVGANSAGAPQLSTNTKYYINIENLPGATCAATGICNMFYDFSKPRGL